MFFSRKSRLRTRRVNGMCPSGTVMGSKGRCIKVGGPLHRLLIKRSAMPMSTMICKPGYSFVNGRCIRKGGRTYRKSIRALGPLGERLSFNKVFVNGRWVLRGGPQHLAAQAELMRKLASPKKHRRGRPRKTSKRSPKKAKRSSKKRSSKKSSKKSSK